MTCCADCKQDRPPREFYKRPDGTPIAYCKPCSAIRAREYRAKRTKPYVPAHVPNPLNSLLRDMPGNRGPLLGIADITDELRAA